MSSVYYANYPKTTITYPTTNLSYVIISYYGNTTLTSATISSGNQTSGSYTTADLSFNILYTFKLTPYDATGVAGAARTITIDTTPKISGTKATYSNSASTKLQWSGTYSYVKISRAFGVGSSGTVGAYTDISSVVLSQPYNDSDLSGNTTYKYYITPYNTSGVASSASSAVSIYTNVKAATDLSAIFYDASAIKISFTAPTKNSYNSSYYYTLSATNGTTGYITSVSGSSSPLMVNDLSDGTIYTCYIMTTLDTLYTGTSNSVSVNTVNQSLYILLVGGGGGAREGCAGGGAGGVIYGKITFQTGSVYTITVGAGGGGYSSKGNDTSISGNGIITLTATGGGNGSSPSSSSYSGGCGGGAASGTATFYSGGASNQFSYSGFAVYGNKGGNNNTVSKYSGGGGGAGGAGGDATSSKCGDGGAGIEISITGSPVIYAAGGGGCLWYPTDATRGLGGSGGVGGNGGNSQGSSGGSGQAYTGSGAGGSGGGGGASQTGGYGVVILSIPTALYSGTHTGTVVITTNGSNTVLTFKTNGTYTAK